MLGDGEVSVRVLCAWVCLWSLGCAGAVLGWDSDWPPVIEHGTDADPVEAAKALIAQCEAWEAVYDLRMFDCTARDASVITDVPNYETKSVDRNQVFKVVEMRDLSRAVADNMRKLGIRKTYTDRTYERVGSHRVEMRAIAIDHVRGGRWEIRQVVGLDHAGHWRVVEERDRFLGF